MRRRSWRWFQVRLVGLVARDTPTAMLVRDLFDAVPAPTPAAPASLPRAAVDAYFEQQLAQG